MYLALLKTVNKIRCWAMAASPKQELSIRACPAKNTEISGTDLEEAEKIGMIYQCVDEETGLNEAIKLTEKIGAMPTKSIGYIKQLLKSSNDNSLEQQLDLEKKLQKEAASSYDHKEGVQAFFEKRRPVYKGK